MTATDDLKKEIRKHKSKGQSKVIGDTIIHIWASDIDKIIDKHLKGKVLVNKKDLLEKIESSCGDAYEIGHAHGRMDKGYINIGWGKVADDLFKVLTRKGKR